MNRLTLTFLSLLGLATLSLGLVWTRASAILTGQASPANQIFTALSALVLAITLTLLVRIVLRTGNTQVPVRVRQPSEDSHE